MAATEERTRGLYFLVLVIAIVVAAGLLFGLTTPAGAIDWVSVVTAVAGLGLVVDGLYLVSHTGSGAAVHSPTRDPDEVARRSRRFVAVDVACGSNAPNSASCRTYSASTSA